MFKPGQPTEDDRWKADARTPGALDKTEVDVQMGHRRIVIRQRMADSIIANTVVLPLALLKGIAVTVLTNEVNAEVAYNQRVVTPPPSGV